MTKGGSKYTKIKIETDTGQLIKITDENGNNATQLTPDDLKEIYQNPAGFRYLGTIFHTHSSPGCVIIHIGGTALRICV